MAEFVNFVNVMNQKQFKVVEILVQTYHITDDYGLLYKNEQTSKTTDREM